MKITKQARRNGKGLFRSCLVNGRLDENRVRSLTKEVMEKKPRGYLPALSHFARLVKLEIERRTTVIESAVALSDAQKSEIRENLTGRYGEGLFFRFQENPKLIGGLRIQVGSDVFDGSVRGRLADLNQQFEITT